MFSTSTPPCAMFKLPSVMQSTRLGNSNQRAGHCSEHVARCAKQMSNLIPTMVLLVLVLVLVLVESVLQSRWSNKAVE